MSFYKLYEVRIIFFIFILLSVKLSFAQREADNWMVKIAWLNFGGGSQPQVAVCPFGIAGPNGGISSLSSATISDKNGNLLFYTDGWFVVNRNHQQMPFHNLFNGNRLFGSNLFGCQNVIITPYPGHDSLYLIFYVGFRSYDNYSTSLLQYAVVNMNRDNGLGDVIIQDVPVLPDGQNVALKMNATLHCNKKDIWLVGHLRNSDKYYSVPITSAGVGTGIVYSTANMISETTTPVNASIYGTLKISALGDKLATAQMGSDFTEVCDFNNQTGVVSNPKKIVVKPAHAIPPSMPFEKSFLGPQSVDFSPSGNKLYLFGTYLSIWTDGMERGVSRLFQFDATQNTEAGLQASGILIDTLLGSYSAMQLANDGKIYVNQTYISYFLSTIDNPEGTGAACNFSHNVLPTAPYAVGGSLPSFVQSFFRYPIISTGNCQFQNITFNIENPIGVSSISWNFGDPASGVNNTSSLFSPTHIFSSEGAYTVKAVLQNSNGCSADTIVKLIHAGPFRVFLGNDTTLCKGDSLQLNIDVPGANNFWNTGSTDSILTVTQAGTYSIRVKLGDCIASDTIVVSFRDLPEFTLGSDSIICNNQSVSLLSNPPFPTASHLWNTNATTTQLTVNTADSYWLLISDDIGCKWRDTINISFKTLPEFNLGRDTAICLKDTLLLNATISSISNYLWNTGEQVPIIKVYQPGIYWCEVIKDGCSYRDSIQVDIKPLPIVQLGPDSTLCEGQSIMLNAANTNASYLWQNGSTGPTFLVTQGGQYIVNVTVAGCEKRDTIDIIYELKPRFTLGGDQFICGGQAKVLKPELNPDWQILWYNGSSGQEAVITEPGLYYLTAQNHCGETRNEIIFKEGLCKIYVPNAFTPNNDGKNDILRVLGTELVTTFHFTIYNKYGQVLFNTTDKSRGWDGKFRGMDQESGTYVWTLHFSEGQNIKGPLKGSVILIR